MHSKVKYEHVGTHKYADMHAQAYTRAFPRVADTIYTQKHRCARKQTHTHTHTSFRHLAREPVCGALDGHAGAVECEGEKHPVPDQAVEVRGEVRLRQRERVAQVQLTVHCGDTTAHNT